MAPARVGTKVYGLETTVCSILENSLRYALNLLQFNFLKMDFILKPILILKIIIIGYVYPKQDLFHGI